jgi:hypothetical protein
LAPEDARATSLSAIYQTVSGRDVLGSSPTKVQDGPFRMHSDLSGSMIHKYLPR